ncbi:MAG: hypothetical protein H0X72_15150 [Acidobacteria bacterium]|nr:hypothetical protein [Acidobacteriota bacterium]
MGENKNHLAFVACRHEKIFSLFDADDDRETSHFLEEVSDFEGEILSRFFEIDGKMKRRFGGFTGALFITGGNSEIVLHEKPA